jgi:hypothetical protein
MFNRAWFCLSLMLRLSVSAVAWGQQDSSYPPTSGYNDIVLSGYQDPMPQTGPQGPPPPAVNGYDGAMPEGSCLGCPERCPRQSRWVVSADAVFMQRVGSRSTTLLTDPVTTGELLNDRDLHYSFEVGPRVDLILLGNCGWDLEAGFFEIDGWDAQATRSNPVNGLEFSAPGGFVFNTNNDVRFDYASRFYTFDINVRNRLSDWLTILGGFRWVQLHELLQGTDIGAANTFWSTNVDNHLYGFQLGGEAKIFDQGGPFRIEALAKAALCENRADQDSAAGAQVAPTARGSRAALFAEARLTAVWQPNDRMALRTGYQAMWLDGVALAPNQINSTNVVGGSSSLDAAGTIFFHGAFVGAEVRF